MQLVVGRIRRPHGVRGDVTVEVRTDDPGGRFAVGAVLATDPAERGPLTIQTSRWHSGVLLVRFAGVEDRCTCGEADLRRGWERKRDDPAVAIYRDLAEAADG